MKLFIKHIVYKLVVGAIVVSLLKGLMIIAFILALRSAAVDRSDPNIVSVYRCAEPSLIRVEYSIIGIGKSGAEYKYGYSIAKEDVPNQHLQMYGDHEETNRFNPYELVVSVPVDASQDRLIGDLPATFYGAASDRQKKYVLHLLMAYLSLEHSEKRQSKYLFAGYTYFGVTESGAKFHLPYLDLLAWSDTTDLPIIPSLREKNLIYVGDTSMDTEKIPYWFYERPWALPEDFDCR